MYKIEKTTIKTDTLPPQYWSDGSDEWLGPVLVTAIIVTITCGIFLLNNPDNYNLQTQAVTAQQQVDTQKQQAATSQEQSATDVRQAATQAQLQSMPVQGQAGPPGAPGLPGERGAAGANGIDTTSPAPVVIKP